MTRELASWTFQDFTVKAARLKGVIKIFLVAHHEGENDPGLVISYEDGWRIRTLTPEPPPPPPPVKILPRRRKLPV